ncbi:MAG TPA: tetratricopeptide repeat protein [Myxococcota bacterium]|nr:tetratricopeptide repeat protein [Myxococcota bacterium]
MSRLEDALGKWGILALIVLTGIAYLPLLSSGFVWDDSALVADNRLTGDLFGNLREILTADLWHTLRLGSADSGYYRPLMLLSLAVDRSLFGLDPAAHHAHSVLWHLACVLALWGLLRKLVPAIPALIGAALFALHPVQIEAVALIAARNDAMAAAFCMAALLLLAELDVRPWRLGLAALLTFLGLLSKESALLAPVLLGCIDLARYGRPRNWKRYVALAIGVIAFLGVRHAAGVGSAALPEWSSFGLVLGKAHLVLGTYGTLLVWPWPLTPARHVLWLPETSWPFLVGGAVATGLIGYALYAGRQRRLGLAGLAWAVAAWVPTLMATVDKGLLGERYLYFPMAGVALLVAGTIPLVPRLLHVLFAGCALAVVAIELRLPDWRTSRTLWNEAHEAFPTAFTAGGLAFYVYQDGDYAEAKQLFVEAVGGDPPYRDACTHLVMVGMAMDDPEEAVRMGSWGLRERGCPPIAETMTHYGLALASLGRWSEAVAIEKQIDRDPFGHALLVLSAESVRRGDFETYKKMRLQWQGGVPLDEQVERLLRLSGDARSHAIFVAWLEGRLVIVTDPSELPPGVVMPSAP